MPRRPKYSPEVQQRICDAIGIGATYEHAAAYGGITYETLNEWRKTKPQFSEALKAAEARAVVGWLAKIEKAASDGTWQAAAWKLERRYPHLYGRTVQQVEYGDQPQRIVVEYASGMAENEHADDAPHVNGALVEAP
jgi:hypothetical protein